MADEESLYDYRTPFESPDRIRLGDKANGNFSSQEYDSDLSRHKLMLYSSTALVGTWDFGADGLIRFNGDPASGGGGGGTALTPEDIAAIHVVEDNIAGVLAVQANVTEINAVAAAIDDGTFDDLSEAVLAASAAQAAQVAAEASEANAAGSALTAATSSAAAAVSATAAAASSTTADGSEVLAKQWATAPVDVDVEPGLKSARAYSQAAQAFGREIAGIPSREQTTATTDVIKTTTSVLGDEFGAIYCTGATNKTITLQPDFNTTPAANGRPSWVPVRIIRTGAGTVTLAGAGGTSITNPEEIGGWQGSYRTPVQPPVGTPPAVVRSISVPAGLNRVLFVTAAEINESATSHTMTLAVSTGTITTRTSDTGATGRYSISPHINAKSWTVALADSASAATAVDVTFTLPPIVHAFAYKIAGAKNVGAVSGVTGSSISVPSTTHSVTVTATAGGMALATIFSQGDGLPASITGGTANAAIASGGLSLKDISMISAYQTGLSAGGRAFSATFDESKEGAVLGCCFDAAAGGGSSVTVLGTPLTVGSNSWVDLMALSDGRTYVVRHGS